MCQHACGNLMLIGQVFLELIDLLEHRALGGAALSVTHLCRPVEVPHLAHITRKQLSA